MTLLNHYWREDDPAEMTAAIGQDWADVLEGIPQEYIQKAAVKYLRTEPRKKPTPAAIHKMASDMMPRPEPKQIKRVSTPSAASRDRVTPEAAARIMKEAGFNPKRFGLCGGAAKKQKEKSDD